MFQLSSFARPHLRSDGKGLITELSLCYSIMFQCNGIQCYYEQFLQVSWLDQALILRGLALDLPQASASSLYLLLSWACSDGTLTWLTNHRPSVLWHCWLGHVTRKTVSEMTYNVSSGTLNSTIPYLCVFGLHGAINFLLTSFSLPFSELSLTIILQCYGTVGRVIWTVKLSLIMCQVGC